MNGQPRYIWRPIQHFAAKNREAIYYVTIHATLSTECLSVLKQNIDDLNLGLPRKWIAVHPYQDSCVSQFTKQAERRDQVWPTFWVSLAVILILIFFVFLILQSGALMAWRVDGSNKGILWATSWSWRGVPTWSLQQPAVILCPVHICTTPPNGPRHFYSRVG